MSYFITHAVCSRMNIAIILCDSVCLHNKPKTTETKIIAKRGTGIVHHDTSPTNIY